MQLEILSPENTIFTGKVNSVIFPGSKGEFQVLNNHAPIISSLSRGKINYKIDSKTNLIDIKGGIVEVLNNKVSALIEK